VWDVGVRWSVSDYVAALFWAIAGLDHRFAKGMDPRVKPAGDEGEWRSLIGKCSGASFHPASISGST
jgi:hypothetical protein